VIASITENNEGSAMDLEYEIPNATKSVILERVIKDLEQEFYEVCTRRGIDMASIAADYAAPAEPADSPDGTTYSDERRIASLNTRIIDAKAKKAAL